MLTADDIRRNLHISVTPGLYDLAVLFDSELVEAWERMTYGGVVVRNAPDVANENLCPPWIPPYVGQAKDGYTEYVAR